MRNARTEPVYLVETSMTSALKERKGKEKGQKHIMSTYWVLSTITYIFLYSVGKCCPSPRNTCFGHFPGWDLEIKMSSDAGNIN